jgi:PAS domain S-box-containing protein
MENKLYIKRIKITFGAAFICLGILMWFTYYNMRNAENESRHVKSALDVLLRLENVLAGIHSIESSQRGFTISGDEKYLEDFDAALNKIRRDTTLLGSLNLSDSTNADERASLLQMINQKVAHTKFVVEVRRLYGYDSASAYMQTNTGKILMDSIASSINNIQNKDRILLQESNLSREKFARQIAWEFAILSILIILILYYSSYIIYTEFSLIEKNEKLLKYNASLIRNIYDPIITTDENYVITNWNEYAQKLYGFTEEEAVGKKIGELLSITYNTESRDNIMGVYLNEEHWKGEVVHHHKDGHPIDVEVTTSTLKDSAGKKQGIVAVIRDITTRKSMENKLQQLTETLQQQVNEKSRELSHVFERITDAFIALDNNWNYTYLNEKAAEMHGKLPGELIGKNIWEEFPDVVDEPFYEALNLARETQQAQRLQLYYSTADKWFEDLIYPSEDGLSVYYHDITEKKKSEITLQKVYEKLSYHINNTPMAVIEFDSNMEILQWSKRAEEIFGWSAAEAIGKNVDQLQIVFEDDIEIVAKSIEDLRAKQANNIVYNRNRTKAGNILFCEWYNSVLRDEEGRTVGIMSIAQDVSARKRIEFELQEAESKFRNLVEQSMVGVYIIQDNQLAYVNPTFAHIFGYDEREMNEDFSPAKLVHPDDRPTVLENINLRMEGTYESMNYELKGVHKNGQQISVEVFGSFTTYRGRPAIIGTLIDITERKKSIENLEASEQALKISNERFLLVAKATNDAVWDWDMVSDKIWGNETFCKIFEINSSEEFTFEKFISRIHPDDRAKLLENFHRSIKNEVSQVTEEFRLGTKSGNYLTVYDKAYVIYDENNQAVRMLGAMQDITEERQAERKLHLEKELSDSIINSLPGVFYLLNRSGRFYRWNKNLETVTGYTSEEIATNDPLCFFSPEDRPRIVKKVEKIFEEGQNSVQVDFIAKDGSRTPYYFTGMYINYEGESCFLGVGIDISERVLSQKQLIESEEKYRTLIDQASDVIFISDEKGDYHDVNSSAEMLTGYKKEELLQMNAKDIIYDDMVRHPFTYKELVDGKVMLAERIMRQKSGQLINVEISSKLLTDGRYQAIIRDITARKMAEEALRISESKYRLLFNKNPMPMWMISIPERKFLDVNPAAIEFYGYSKEEFLSMNIFDITVAEINDDLILKSYSNANGYASQGGIWEQVKKDGSTAKINMISHDIVYEGKIAKLVLASDETDKIAAEENLKKSHEDLRQLATHLEHIRESERTYMAREIHDELGQQLTGLKMDISWLNRKIKSTDEDVLQKLKDTIQLIDKTVITVRRIATQLRPSILDDLGLVAAMEWQSEEFEKRSEIRTIFNTNAGNLEVSADIATGIFRIFQESLTNVLRHADATAVYPSLNVSDNNLELVVEDNGKGFNTSDIKSKRTLGLLGMKERVLIMGGTYQISSEPGHGTLVRIIVPLEHLNNN